MNKLLITISALFFMSSTPNDLYYGVKFEHKRAHKNNVCVLYKGIGKAISQDNDVITHFEKNFKSHTALGFCYNDYDYYLSINNNCSFDFLNVNIGDTIYLGIIIFDSIGGFRDYVPNKEHYYSYVSNVSKKN